TAAATFGLAALRGVGAAAASGLAAYKAYNVLSGDAAKEGDLKSAESDKSLIEQAGRKILEEISQQPPSTSPSPTFGGSLSDQLRELKQPATPEAQRNQITSGILDLSGNPLQSKVNEAQKDSDKGGFLKNVSDLVKTLEIPKLPELSQSEKPQPASSLNPAPQSTSTVKPSEPALENKSGFIQAAIEKLGMNSGGSFTPAEQPAKSPEANGSQTVSPD